jgi:hypothetical protein
MFCEDIFCYVCDKILPFGVESYHKECVIKKVDDMWVKIGTDRVCVDGLIRYDYEIEEEEDMEFPFYRINLYFKNDDLSIKLTTIEMVDESMSALDKIFLSPYDGLVKKIYKDACFKGE